MATISKGVLYLERERFQLSIDLRPDVIVFQFPPDIVSNLDIIDTEGFKMRLSDFIKQNKIVFTNMIILLSKAVIFEKDFTTKEEEKIQEYLDNIPYETIGVKKISTQNGTKVLVGNATFYTLLEDIFEKNGVTLTAVLPETALGSQIQTFNASTARFILSQLDALSVYKFIIDKATEDHLELKPVEEPKKIVKKNASLLYLLPVMGVLLLILLFIILQPILFKPKPKSYAPANPPVIVPTIALTTIPIITPTSFVPIPSTSIQARRISSVQIIYDPSVSAKVDEMRARLTSLSITNIQPQPTASDISVPLLLLKPDIDANEKQLVSTEVRKLFPTVNVQESSTQSVDVSLTIGKAN